MYTILPKTIFDQCYNIPSGKGIYRSQKNHTHKFGNVNTISEKIIYLIPDNNIKGKLNKRCISKNELEALWSFLIENKKMTTPEFKNICPALYYKSTCSVGVFFGIINYLFPKSFEKSHSCIKFKEERKMKTNEIISINLE
jgi:hypothetical protein